MKKQPQIPVNIEITLKFIPDEKSIYFCNFYGYDKQKLIIELGVCCYTKLEHKYCIDFVSNKVNSSKVVKIELVLIKKIGTHGR